MTQIFVEFDERSNSANSNITLHLLFLGTRCIYQDLQDDSSQIVQNVPREHKIWIPNFLLTIPISIPKYRQNWLHIIPCSQTNIHFSPNSLTSHPLGFTFSVTTLTQSTTVSRVESWNNLYSHLLLPLQNLYLETCRKKKLEYLLSQYTRRDSKWIRALSVRPETKNY